MVMHAFYRSKAASFEHTYDPEDPNVSVRDLMPFPAGLICTPRILNGRQTLLKLGLIFYCVL